MKRVVILVAIGAVALVLGAIAYVLVRGSVTGPVGASPTLQIPLRYFEDDAGLIALLHSLPGLDRESREMLLTVNASEVAANVPRFQERIGRYRDDLRLRLTLLSDSERTRYIDPHRFQDIANASNSYVDRIIEHDRERGLIRIYRKIEYRKSWEVFRVSPNEASLPLDLNSSWVAHCVGSNSPLTPSGWLALCKSHVLVGNIAVHFTISDENLSNIDEVKVFIRRLLRTWQRTT